MYHRFQESLQGMLVVKAFNYEAGAIAKFGIENDAFWSQMMRYLRATALSGPLMEFLGALILTLILWLGGREILGDRERIVLDHQPPPHHRRQVKTIIKVSIIDPFKIVAAVFVVEMEVLEVQRRI